MFTSIVALNVPGFAQPARLFVHGEEDLHVSRQLRERGIWEPYETALLLRILEPGDTFVDVGANIGYFSILAASVLKGSGAVYSFEPDPENFRLLLASAELNGLAQVITAERAGLSDRAAEGRLYLSEDNLGDHQIFAAGEEARGSVAITLLNGTEYLASRISRLDLLKVDTQGSEYAVMKGLMPLLQSLDQKPRIIIELTPLSLRQAGASGRQLIELLATLGQPMWIIDHIEHRLAASSAEDLAGWCDNVDAISGDAGFMNILVGPAI